ncbi:flagellar hook assembly protein FlgD [Orenia marismortui]|uniref:Flagellar basal-body rod modification protein FlgD n=1 Tax=Orenia marismortui TaxID=46469 RepID=A0A4R8H9S8_9FIRM|nr:flagellar hook capping FlgD N-terminal domain-containing protein [Orenia marismortui]TDX51928.1 flagellar basal-body rod modification protein FlgD [Orenia marismortui]
MSTVEGTSYSSVEDIRNSGNATTKTNKNELTTDDFLSLLVTELQYQDPTEPMENSQMMSQMTEYTSLQQSDQLTKTIENLNTSISSLINYQQFSQAGQLIGKEVTVEQTNSESEEVETITGKIEKVDLSDGNINVVIDGESYSVANIQEILS